MKEIIIAGAGPAGITAGINLALRGYKVVICDKAQEVGARFTNDFQALENYSHHQDIIDLLVSLNLPLDFARVPLFNLELLDSRLNRTVVKSQKVGMYLVKRGTDSDSFDQALKRHGLALGIEFRLGQGLNENKADIVAWGPKRAVMVAAGLNFRTSSTDRVALVFSNHNAPGGYAYLVIARGKGTMATLLFRNFARAKEYLALAVELFKKVYDLEISEPASFVGYGDFHLRRSYSQNGTLWAGEAAGLQDYWFGFGIRYALTSGFLAARTISEGLSYNELLRAEGVIEQAKASLANRFLFELRGRRSYQWLIKGWGQSSNITELMRQKLQLSSSRKIIYYLARLAWGRKRKLIDPLTPPRGLSRQALLSPLPSIKKIFPF